VPKISALVHVENDAATLGRLLETLRVCDEILVIDHGSQDGGKKIAHQYGAKVKAAVPGVEDGAYAVDCHHDWVLCLLPNESLSETLETSLLEWKQTDPGATVGYSVQVREGSPQGWRVLGRELRLANRKELNWTGKLPGNASAAAELNGDLLRFNENS
jgi:glycosyltransferase involved in cell wall biosynthesis